MQNSIHIIDNIFSNKQRKKLIKDSHPHFFVGGEDSDLNKGRLKTSYLHLHKDFKSPSRQIVSLFEKDLKVRLEIANLWITSTRGESIPYHTHYFDYSCVYYMKTNPLLRNNGTVFKFSDNSENLVKAPQNSAMLFPCSFLHTVPSFFLPIRRYSLAMDLVIVNDDGTYKNFLKLNSITWKRV